MSSAQGYRELVAHLEPHRARLGESEMVSVSGASRANQTRLRCHEFEVSFIAQSTRLAERQLAFIDPGGSYVGFLLYRSRGVVIDRWLRGDRRCRRMIARAVDLSGTTPRPLGGVR